MSEPNNGPLLGIRVIEFARVLAGPWCGQLLADMGADVIKVENPDGGDETRHWGPPFIKGADGKNLSAAYFHSCNRGKRSIALDLKNDADLKTARDLCADADVIIENFKVDTMARFGLDFGALKTHNPSVVYCSITGFGQTGPYAHRAGYDFIIQGMSGFMSITGEADGMPMKAGVAITDILSGLNAAAAINAALVGALKTGTGRHVDISLFEVMSAALANQNMNYLATGQTPQRLGNAHPNIAPYQVIETRDGHIILAVGNDGQFTRFCTIIERSELTDDPRFATNANRVENRAALTQAITAVTRKWTRDELVLACENKAVPIGPINTIQDMFNDPQIIARKLQVSNNDGAGNVIAGVRSPVFFDGFAASHHRASPLLGEHQEEILEELNQRQSCAD